MLLGHIGPMNLSKSLVSQLRQRLTEDAAIAVRTGDAAKDAAQHSVTAMEKKQDSRAMIEQGNMAFAQARRAEKSLEHLQALDTFVGRGLPTFTNRSPVGLGAVIEASCDDGDKEFARTFVMLPVGAGEELTGPDGDGIITVITPSSPVGRAMQGKHAGDVAEVIIKREPLEWEIIEVCC